MFKLYKNFQRYVLASIMALSLLMFGSVSAWADPATIGSWAAGPNFPWFPVHVNLLPTGKIMMWPGNGVSGNDPRVYDPTFGTITPLAKPGYDIFCGAHLFLPDGRLFVAGGHIQNYFGLDAAAIYDPVGDSWALQPSMNAGRWYPSLQMLPNGDAVVISGSTSDTSGSDPLPQVWQAATGTWRDLSGAQLQLPLYPYLHLAPNGKVFNSGPSVQTRYLDTTGTGAWTTVGNHVNTNGVRDYGGSVMYAPGKILNVGGGDPPTRVAEVIDLNAATPQWRSVALMNYHRRHLNATVLPDGKVLVTGGTQGPGFSNDDPVNQVYAAEMWDPATEKWTVMDSATVPRRYHSAAVLMPDGRVLSTGGDGYTQTEYYSPPYLFAGPRPTLTSAPANVGKGQSFFVSTPDAASVDAVSWIKIGSVTHTTNMNQGVFFSNTITRSANGITITAPNLTAVPIGHYMLFLMRGGVPSIAKTVRLDANTTSNPVPTLSSISPSSATAGSAAFTLTVNGSSFVNGATVRWNGADRTTTFVSATQLTAAIPASDIATAGTAQVTVFNPTPGGGTSSAQTFTINTSTSNPVPTLSSISPSSATAGGAAFTLTVNGSSFVNGAAVRWNGANRTTTFVSATQLTAAIPASDIAAAGTAQVTVFNPSPGGGTSSAQTFTITSGGGTGQNLAGQGTIIARVTAPTGGGSKNIGIIRDGVKPPVGSTDNTLQYDTFDGANTSPNDWIGYQFSTAQNFNRVVFQEGKHFTDGGWFTTLTVQVRQAGTWVNVSNLSITPAYPGVNNGVNFESYTLQFTPISGDAIRIYGDPGGSADFISVGELEVYADATSPPPNAVPTLSSISPSSATAGGAAFTLTVNGSSFVNGASVLWNGTTRTTTFVSATQLTAAIPASDIAAAGTAQVTVFNPTPGGGTSSAQTFTITSGGGTGQNLAGQGTIIARVTAPTGGGSKNIGIIRDGVKPPVGSTDSSLQYDTYDGANTAPEDWIGYQFSSPQNFNRVVFQEGKHFADGGWFTTLTVQVRQAGTWVNVSNLSITPAYPGVNNGVNFESYTLQFTPISGDAIRIDGAPGGSAAFISVGELEVYAQ